MARRAHDGEYFDYFGDWGSPEPSDGSASGGKKQEELIHIFTQDYEVVTIGPKRAQVRSPDASLDGNRDGSS